MHHSSQRDNNRYKISNQRATEMWLFYIAQNFLFFMIFVFVDFSIITLLLYH